MRRLGVGLFCIAAAAVYPCATLVDSGKPVPMQEEKVVLIWDQERETQHFVRTAHFGTKAEDIGFLVPLPSEPTITEADPDIFSVVAYASRRWLDMTEEGGQAKGAVSSVAVLQQVEVGGYEVSVLKAADESALVDWLDANGYPSSPAIEDWAASYVAKEFVITAFKFAGNDTGVIATKPICLSFKTDRLYYPYREPSSAASAHPRVFEAYVVSSQPLKPVLENGEQFRGRPTPDIELSAEEQDLIAQYVGQSEGSFARLDNLAKFTDLGWQPRADADIWFEPNPDSTPHPLPKKDTWILYVIGAMAILPLWVAHMVRSRQP